MTQKQLNYFHYSTTHKDTKPTSSFNKHTTSIHFSRSCAENPTGMETALQQCSQDHSQYYKIWLIMHYEVLKAFNFSYSSQALCQNSAYWVSCQPTRGAGSPFPIAASANEGRSLPPSLA